jgi:arylsulfatase A-like enzyme
MDRHAFLKTLAAGGGALAGLDCLQLSRVFAAEPQRKRPNFVFIVRWPGKVPAGRVDDTSIVSGVDFLPTVCGLAGVPLPDGLCLDGEDMSAALLGTPAQRTTTLFWEFRTIVVGPVINKSPMLAIREGNWKLLMNPDRSRLELYDIPKDPSELNNLVERQPETTERLASRLLAWREELTPGAVEAAAGDNSYPWPKGSQ